MSKKRKIVARSVVLVFRIESAGHNGAMEPRNAGILECGHVVIFEPGHEMWSGMSVICGHCSEGLRHEYKAKPEQEPKP